MREYTNPPISREEQLEVLLTRGLLVTDKHEAVKYLDSINYFRLACYLQPFESPTSPLKYKEGTSFSRFLWHMVHFGSINISTLGFPASWSSEPLWEGC